LGGYSPFLFTHGKLRYNGIYSPLYVLLSILLTKHLTNNRFPRGMSQER